MIRGIFARNVKTTTMQNDNHNVNVISQSWDFYFCRINSKPASIALNLGLKKHAPIAALPILLTVIVDMQHPDESGFSTRDEFETLGEIEDHITEYFQRDLEAMQVGRIKSDGKQELLYYAPNGDGLEDVLKNAMADFSTYRYRFGVRTDADWSEYTDFLYPDPYQYQAIQNRRVVQQLEEQGDKLEQEREVDHWLYFTTEADMNSYISEVEKLGYKVLSQRKEEEKESSFILNIARNDKVVWNIVNEYVWELCDIAEKHNGSYDGWGCPVQK